MTKRQLSAGERAERLKEVLEREPCIKRAAYLAGIPYRTACRYRERLAA